MHNYTNNFTQKLLLNVKRGSAKNLPHSNKRKMKGEIIIQLKYFDFSCFQEKHDLIHLKKKPKCAGTGGDYYVFCVYYNILEI